MSPQIIGPYRVLRTLGGGAAGTVYEAQKVGSDEPVAVKVLHVAKGSPQHLLRFRREVTLLQKHPHPDLLPVLDARLEDVPFYLATPVLAGGSLADHRDPETVLPVPKVLAAGAAVARALAHLHAHGVVHRDVKPANILRTAEGRAILGDLGLGRAADSDTLTLTGHVVGTPYFLPPEIYLDPDRSQDKAGDMYALGITLVWLLTGECPVRSLGHLDVPWEKIRAARVPRLARLLGDLLSTSPEARPTAAEAAPQLESMAGRGPLQTGELGDIETQTQVPMAVSSVTTLDPEAEVPQVSPGPPPARRLLSFLPLAVLLGLSATLLYSVSETPASRWPRMEPAKAPATVPPPLDPGPWRLSPAVRDLGHEATPLRVVPATEGQVLVVASVGHRVGPREFSTGELVLTRVPVDPSRPALPAAPRVSVHRPHPGGGQVRGLATDGGGVALLLPGPLLVLLNPDLEPRCLIGPAELGALAEPRLLGLTTGHAWLAAGDRILAVSRGGEVVVRTLQGAASVEDSVQRGGELVARLSDGSWVQLLDPEPA